MKKKYMITSAALVLAVVAVIFAVRNRDGAEHDLPVLSGNVEVTEADLGFKYGGRVTVLLKEEGQSVHAGEALAVLDRGEAEGLVAHSRSQLAEAEVKLAELKAGARQQELEQARAQVAHAEAVLDRAKKDHERYERLSLDGLVSAQQRDAVRSSYLVADSELTKARESFDLIREGPRAEVVRAAEARVKQAAASLLVAEERLKETLLSAPMSGVILRKHAEPGEIVSPAMPVFTLGDLSRPWIRVYVKESKLGLVRLGQKAEIATDSFPGKRYEGVVTFIASEAEFTPKNIQTHEERVKLVFGVKVSVTNENDELKPGMPADVKIIKE